MVFLSFRCLTWPVQELYSLSFPSQVESWVHRKASCPCNGHWLVTGGLWYCLMSSHIFCSHWEFCVIWRFSWHPLLMTSTSASGYKLTFHCELLAPTSDLHLSIDPVAFPGTCTLLAVFSSLSTLCQTSSGQSSPSTLPLYCAWIILSTLSLWWLSLHYTQRSRGPVALVLEFLNYSWVLFPYLLAFAWRSYQDSLSSFVFIFFAS